MTKEQFVPKIIQKLAPMIGATVLWEPEYGFGGQITFKNGKKSFFWHHILNINYQGSVEISTDKGFASSFLKTLGYNVPEGKTFFSDEVNERLPANSKRNIDDGFKFAKTLGFPVIVKPNSLTQGMLVTKVHSQIEYYQTAEKIFLKDSVLIVERFYSGRDYRIVVLDDEVMAAYERIPLFVLGDGTSSILELALKRKETFATNSRKARVDIEDYRIQNNLQKQNLNWESVLPEGAKLSLLDNANLTTGGEAVDVTEEIHPDFYKLAVSITKDMGLRLCGVDIITGNIADPLKDYVVLEINGTPGLRHYASLGDIQAKRVENLYLKILKAMESA
ncbi:cyanophycin synthetase [Kamptonema formosum]|uniref:cyanophycin synthetase n=1 Tax=Kamptonema formosum TaxID=331992 RepID=UPI000477B15E|nr:cyanophycin synthetase [Oscillatoria sp. PCC 10802]